MAKGKIFSKAKGDTDNAETPEVEAVAEATQSTPASNRVTLKNANPTNGVLGTLARPLIEDADAWRARGWVDAN